MSAAAAGRRAAARRIICGCCGGGRDVVWAAGAGVGVAAGQNAGGAAAHVLLSGQHLVHNRHSSGQTKVRMLMNQSHGLMDSDCLTVTVSVCLSHSK